MTAELTHEAARGLVLEGWVAGRATGDEARLQAHLARCAECAGYAERIRDGLAALRAEHVTVEPDLLMRTHARLRAHAASRALSGTRAWLPAAAALLACGAFACWALAMGRLVAWSAPSLGIAPVMASLVASLFWFLPSAATAAAILLLPASARPPAGRLPGQSPFSFSRQVQS